MTCDNSWFILLLKGANSHYLMILIIYWQDKVSYIGNNAAIGSKISVEPTPIQGGNGYGEETDLPGCVGGHFGCDYLNHVYLSQLTTDFILTVLEYQWHRRYGNGKKRLS